MKNIYKQTSQWSYALKEMSVMMFSRTVESIFLCVIRRCFVSFFMVRKVFHTITKNTVQSACIREQQYGDIAITVIRVILHIFIECLNLNLLCSLDSTTAIYIYVMLHCSVLQGKSVIFKHRTLFSCINKVKIV